MATRSGRTGSGAMWAHARCAAGHPARRCSTDAPPSPQSRRGSGPIRPPSRSVRGGGEYPASYS
eukprot:10564644-Alexandrium_andersonii.AAC.1